LLGAGYAFDKLFYASSITRSLRTFKTGLTIGLDYKINFRAHPPFANSIEEVHARNAQRIFDLLRYNGGLYLKIGQAIAMQSAILPPEFAKMFQKMFDDAPQNEWADVERVVREDFGKSVEEVFGVSFTREEGKGMMEKTARASASVAQVHWARLADGREVAIKIQKREIVQQVGWDLWAFKVVAKAYTWWFGIPIYTLVPYITERLMLETDFENEANNAEEMRHLVHGEKRLAGRVYIPGLRVCAYGTRRESQTVGRVAGEQAVQVQAASNFRQSPRPTRNSTQSSLLTRRYTMPSSPTDQIGKAKTTMAV
jgi:aarF domain-containing kinase